MSLLMDSYDFIYGGYETGGAATGYAGLLECRSSGESQTTARAVQTDRFERFICKFDTFGPITLFQSENKIVFKSRNRSFAGYPEIILHAAIDH